MKSRIIPRGLDFLYALRSDQYIELSPELLGQGMEPFHETVTMIGAPIESAHR
jgi:hypothetical protein